jgi:hypothetical protein
MLPSSAWIRLLRRSSIAAAVGLCVVLVVAGCREDAIVAPSAKSATDILMTGLSHSPCKATGPSLSPHVEGDVLTMGDGAIDPIGADEPTGDEVSSSNSYCDQEYRRLITGCRKLASRVNRAICYAASMDWYASCLHPQAPGRCGGTALDGTAIDDSQCTDDNGAGGGGVDPVCGFEEWEISYDGGATWEDLGFIWTCE